MKSSTEIVSQQQELALLRKSYEDFRVKRKAEEQRLHSLNRLIEQRSKALESKEKQLHSVQRQLSFCYKEIDAKEKRFEGQMKDLESKKKRFEGQMKDLEYKEKQCERRMKMVESREAQFKTQLNKVNLKEKQLEGKMRDVEFRKNRNEERVKKLELKEAEFKLQQKDLESKQKQHEGLVKELELKEKQYESLRKSFEEEKKVLKENHQVKEANSKEFELFVNLLKKYEFTCTQVFDSLRTSDDPTKLVLDTIKGFSSLQLGSDANIFKRIFNLLIDELNKSSPEISFQVKEEATKLASDWKEDIAENDCFEVLDFFKFIVTYEIGPSFNVNELQRLLYIITHQCQAPQQVHDNQSSPITTDGGHFQLLSHKPELTNSYILANIQTSPDPAKLVLDVIQNPILPQNMKGSEGLIIDESHIFVLQQLMRISPRINPLVREEALKLAFDLKENMERSTEISWVVLGFLLLLSIYGLVSYFNEVEVLKLLEFAAQHKQTIELFRNLGFVDKIYDFIQNLIRKKQYIEAVGFICAYELAEKIQPVNLLRQHMLKVKQISQRYGRESCNERKVRVKEIASLGVVLQCISDNNLESQDLVNEIKDRINFLEKENENIVSETLESSSIVEAITNNQVQQPKEKKRANEVGQPSHKISSDGAVTLNQVKGRQPELTMCNTEAVIKTQVQQPQDKKRAIETVSGGQQLSQWDNNKRPRTGVTRTCSLLDDLQIHD